MEVLPRAAARCRGVQPGPGAATQSPDTARFTADSDAS